MIDPNNLAALLRALNFEAHGNQYRKAFAQSGVILAVDFDKKELLYPENQGLKINERQTCQIKISVPILSGQQAFVAGIETLEYAIAEARTDLAAAPAQKQAILQRYL